MNQTPQYQPISHNTSLEPRTYKAIFFDLDGTLLNIDMDDFLEQYFKGIAKFAARHGFDPENFTKALTAGVKSMTDETGGTNGERYWATFEAITGKARAEAEPLLLEYYQTDFNQIGADITPMPQAHKALQILKNKKYPLFLTTMPLFPLVAVEQRLQWAGLDASFFDRITTYDNSHSTKPHAAYYQENVDALGLPATDILMVGNNTREDLAAMQLGIDAYLVTDCLLNPNEFDVEQVKHGSLVDFLSFVQTLEDCERS